MELNTHFNTLLEDTVNLPASRLELLSQRVDTLVGKLQESDQLGELVTGKSPQGSWAHRTIIKPHPGFEYDADVLVHMDENSDWSDSKVEYLKAMDTVFGQSGYKNRERKTRCVRVIYANDSHIDLVPYVRRASGRKIVNSQTGEWEDSNPEGFSRWMAERDQITKKNFRKVVRLVKFLRDHRRSFTNTPSIILTTLLGNRVSGIATFTDPRAYENVPKALTTILQDLDEWMQENPIRPSIVDPSSPGTTFDHRWNADTYSKLRDCIHRVADEVREALDEENYVASLLKWQALLGDGFRGEEPKESSSSPLTGLSIGASSSRSGRAG